MVELSSDTNAVSAIVGALMIVVITVAAASAFAVFTSQKQAEIQKADLLKTQQSLENIKVLSITPKGTTDWLWLNFTIVNISPEQSTVINAFVNDHQLRQFNVTRYNETLHNYITQRFNILNLTFQTLLPAAAAGPIQNGAFTLKEQEQVTFSVNILNDTLDHTTILTSDNVKIELVTKFGNSFSRTFIPPSAVIKINIESLPSGGTFTPYIILDGAESYHPEDGYIIAWNWNVIQSDDSTNNGTLRGPKVNLESIPSPFTLITGKIYNITLKVTDNYGLIGETTFPYTY